MQKAVVAGTAAGQRWLEYDEVPPAAQQQAEVASVDATQVRNVAMRNCMFKLVAEECKLTGQAGQA